MAQKTKAAIDAGLSVILCIGETLEERVAGKCTEVINTQLEAVVLVTKEADWRCVSCYWQMISVSDVCLMILQQNRDRIRACVGHWYGKSRDN